jgi:mono/diheme cytochrome c family protein
MGDLMTMAVQPRHIKLGLAGRQNNWTYAAYELNELRNAFARIARTIPKYQTMDTAEMMTALTKAPLDALDQAITTANPAQFKAAYAQLTQTCNACHLSQKHGAVVIKVPDAAMFSDQDFTPKR